MEGKVIETLTGNDLKGKGFETDLEGVYSGELFEISGNK
jgi:hypothetical protein